MSYTPTNWQTGDVVSSEKLNNIENGLADSGTAWFEVSRSNLQPYTLNKTAQEICDAVAAGARVFYRLDTGGGGDVFHHLMVVTPLPSTNRYAVEFQFMFPGSYMDIYKFRAESMNGYPIDDYDDTTIYDDEYYTVVDEESMTPGTT